MSQANLFDLHNATLKVSYSASSLDGKPQLTYQKGKTTLSFRGSQIRQKVTEIGTQLTVTLQSTPDLRSILFTIVLPQVNVPEGAPVKVDIKAIETASRTSIGGPNLVKGQVQTYKVYTLKGTAQSVFF